MIRARWRLISATSRRKYPASQKRARSNRRVRLGNRRRRRERRGRRSIGSPQRRMRRTRSYVLVFTFSRLRSPLSCPAPRPRLASLPEFRPRYARRDRNPDAPALSPFHSFYALPRVPAAHKRARASRDTMGPKTLIRTDLRVDAIATSGSLVAAGASQLTGRLWSGAVLVCAFTIPRFPVVRDLLALPRLRRRWSDLPSPTPTA